MSERSKKADEKRSKFWTYHLEGWSKSGQSQKAYCRDNNLKSNRLTYWKNKFKRQNLPVEFVQIPLAQIRESHHSQPREGLKLNVESGFQIEIPDEFSNAALTQVLHILRQF